MALIVLLTAECSLCVVLPHISRLYDANWIQHRRLLPSRHPTRYPIHSSRKTKIEQVPLKCTPLHGKMAELVMGEFPPTQSNQ